MIALPADSASGNSLYPYCQILDTPEDSGHPYALVITYTPDFWTVQPMRSLEAARRRAEEWQQIWQRHRPEGAAEGWLIARATASGSQMMD